MITWSIVAVGDSKGKSVDGGQYAHWRAARAGQVAEALGIYVIKDC